MAPITVSAVHREAICSLLHTRTYDLMEAGDIRKLGPDDRALLQRALRTMDDLASPAGLDESYLLTAPAPILRAMFTELQEFAEAGLPDLNEELLDHRADLLDYRADECHELSGDASEQAAITEREINRDLEVIQACKSILAQLEDQS